jgi:hypothetical protein
VIVERAATTDKRLRYLELVWQVSTEDWRGL